MVNYTDVKCQINLSSGIYLLFDNDVVLFLYDTGVGTLVFHYGDLCLSFDIFLSVLL